MKTVKRNAAARPQADLRLRRLPPPITRSPLMRKGGFGVFEGVLDKEGHALMLSEAVRLSIAAETSDVTVSDREEVRGGTPARHFMNVAGGPVQESFYHSPGMKSFLRDLCGFPVKPTGGRGTYSFYAQAGDYLDIHRDIESCDVAVITCLHNGPRREGQGGALCLYPARLFEPLSAVRSTPDRGAVLVSLEPGQTIVMFGGIIPHTLLPVAREQIRIVSVLCYRAEI